MASDEWFSSRISWKDVRIRLLRLAFIATVSFAVGGILGFTFCVRGANAHPGGMAADGCHTKKATGVRHAHVNIQDGTRVDVECEVRRAIMEGQSASAEVEKENAAYRTQVKSLEAQIIALKQSRNSYRVRARASEAKAANEQVKADLAEYEYKGLMAAAHKDRKAAKTTLAEAKAKVASLLQVAEVIVSQAESRERGAGPPANRDCQRTLRMRVIDRRTGWITDDVGVDADDRNAIEHDCFGK